MKGQQVLVRVGRHALGRPGDLLQTVGLGSCIAITLHDRVAGVGGMAHVLLPDPSLARDASNPFKFASTAVPELLRLMREAGAQLRRVEARLVGGAGMFTALSSAMTLQVGERNVAAAREALRRARVPVRGEEVGGDWGRSVHFDIGQGTVRVTSVYRDDVLL